MLCRFIHLIRKATTSKEKYTSMQSKPSTPYKQYPNPNELFANMLVANAVETGRDPTRLEEHHSWFTSEPETPSPSPNMTSTQLESSDPEARSLQEEYTRMLIKRAKRRVANAIKSNAKPALPTRNTRRNQSGTSPSSDSHPSSEMVQEWSQNFYPPNYQEVNHHHYHHFIIKLNFNNYR